MSQPDGTPLGATAPEAAIDLGFAKLDVDRLARTGDPEVVYGAGKTPEHIVGPAGSLHQAHPDRAALATRLAPDALELVRRELPEAVVDEVARA